ncbi:MAG: hypothetical protein AAF529_11615 [Pseudomonadota bacterium]
MRVCFIALLMIPGAYTQGAAAGSATSVLERYLQSVQAGEYANAYKLLSARDQQAAHHSIVYRYMAKHVGSGDFQLQAVDSSPSAARWRVAFDTASYDYQLVATDGGWRVHLGMIEMLERNRAQDEITALLSAADEYMRRKMYRRSIAIYQRAMRIDPDNELAQLGMARAEQAQRVR